MFQAVNGVGETVCFISDTSDGRGFNQWKEAGRKVKKGSKAFYILAPCIVKEKDKTTGEKTGRDICVGFRCVPVFRVEDTEGDALPTYSPPNPPPLQNVVESWNIDLGYIPSNGTYWGYHSGNTLGDKEKIRLATYEESTFFHELAHAGHLRIAGKLKGGQHVDQEIIAELSSAVLMRLYGLQTDGSEARSYEYIKGYAAKNKKDIGKACLKVVNTVGQVLDVILQAAKADSVKAA